MPNVSAAKWRKRILYSHIVYSILLYGSPTWARDMCASGWDCMKKVQRRISLRTASAYCTVSGDSVVVITDVAPLDITTKHRSDHYNDRRNPGNGQTRENPLTTWQRKWEESKNGRWTQTLTRDLRPWVLRKHGEINFHLTQVISGHGCFSTYLHKYAKLESAECWYCSNPTDNACHIVFECDAWHVLRNKAETYLGSSLTPRNMITILLSSKRNWHIVDDLVLSIMRRKEKLERRR